VPEPSKPTAPTPSTPLTTATAQTAPPATAKSSEPNTRAKPDVAGTTSEPSAAQPPETKQAETINLDANKTTPAVLTETNATKSAPSNNSANATGVATGEQPAENDQNSTEKKGGGTPSAHDTDKAHGKDGDHGHNGDHGHDHHAHGVPGKGLSVLWVIPFVGMLLSIAIMPLVVPHFWHGNYGKVAAGWITVFAIPFLATFKGPALYEILHIVLLDFVPFIILLAALFTAAGGICLKGSLRGSPGVNTLILFIGTVLASWMGTTGAAMLLIRPILRANAWRKHQVHVVVFFIFLVANIGGSLTPLGDPPLFLGFLKGVDFFWTMKLLPVMAPVSLVLLVIFFIFDSYKFRDEGTPPDDGEKKPLRLQGAFNFVMVGCIIGAILFSKSLADGTFKDADVGKKMNPQIEKAEKEMDAAKDKLKAHVDANKGGTFDESNTEYFNLRKAHLHAVTDVNKLRADKSHDETMGYPIYHVKVPYANMVRDGLLILIALISLWYTPMYRMEKDEHGHEVPAPGEEDNNVRAANGFTWEPILEVAKLFIAIFICMIPALKILQAGVDGELKSVILAVQSSTNDPVNMMYFWLTGILSSFLDNAPTYVVFFNTAGGDPTTLMGPMAQTLLAISCGAVFMGANTYIGNAPNFMVKAIAEENGVKMPSFFGYMAWSVCILIPVFIIVGFVYFMS
jgi:Na+/H+ antiporter NhaD/arsenite permease-like protein